jgi:hypothetical protein
MLMARLLYTSGAILAHGLLPKALGCCGCCGPLHLHDVAASGVCYARSPFLSWQPAMALLCVTNAMFTSLPRMLGCRLSLVLLLLAYIFVGFFCASHPDVRDVTHSFGKGITPSWYCLTDHIISLSTGSTAAVCEQGGMKQTEFSYFNFL